jgi:FG-GAP-like repeat
MNPFPANPLLTVPSTIAPEPATTGSAANLATGLSAPNGLRSLAASSAQSVDQFEEYVVTNTNDSGEGSLRAALLAANQDLGTETIRFNIPGIGLQEITLQSLLPTITETIFLDGWTQGDASLGVANYQGNPLVSLRGTGLNAGLVLAAGSNGSYVQGLILRDFQGTALTLQSDANQIRGNHLLANVGAGIAIAGGKNNVIGGSEAFERNWIAGNQQAGVAISGSAATGNQVRGNRIGTDLAGEAAQGNVVGIRIVDGANNVIGGGLAGDRNLISGNSQDGIVLENTTGNQIRGNWIGTNLTGTRAIANGVDGIYLFDSANNLIGGVEAGDGNLIAGQTSGNGIYLDGAASYGNRIHGNLIGTDITGQSKLANLTGILIANAEANLIGGATATLRNIISGNETGIAISGASAQFNQIRGNYIGVAKDGVTALGNTRDGITIDLGASYVLIGEPSTGDGNIIAYNGLSGINILDPSSIQNRIYSNSIFSNQRLAIDLNNDGATANDLNDLDGGANQLLNHPQILTAKSDRQKITIQGQYQGAANFVLTLEFFTNPSSSNGKREGRSRIDRRTILTDAEGEARFQFTLSQAILPGEWVTVTATDGLGNTSEFSEAIQVIYNPAVGNSSDFDGDGDADLLWRNASTGELLLWEMNGMERLRDFQLGTVSDRNWQIQATADFDRDGQTDILWHHQQTGDLYLWKIQDKAVVSQLKVQSTGNGDWQLRGTGDFNQDGFLDLLWNHQRTGEVHLWQLQGMTYQQSIILPSTGDPNWQIQGLGDFDTDGDLDIVWRYRSNGSTVLWQLDRTQYQASLTLATTGNPQWQIKGIGDWDFDGDLDLLWHQTATGEVVTWELNQGQLVQGLPLVATGSSVWQVQQVSDFDGDGDPDLLWRSRDQGKLVFWQMGVLQGRPQIQQAPESLTIDPIHWFLPGLNVNQPIAQT